MAGHEQVEARLIKLQAQLSRSIGLGKLNVFRVFIVAALTSDFHFLTGKRLAFKRHVEGQRIAQINLIRVQVGCQRKRP